VDSRLLYALPKLKMGWLDAHRRQMRLEAGGGLTMIPNGDQWAAAFLASEPDYTMPGCPLGQ